MAEKKRTYQEKRADALAEMSQKKNLKTGKVEVRYAGTLVGEYPNHYEAIKRAPDHVLNMVRAQTSKSFKH